MRLLLVYVWLFIHLLLILIKDMKKFFLRNLDWIVILFWFIGMLVVTNMIAQ